MLLKLRQRAEDEKGFTLIELLVVILIIGILAAIAIPSFLNQKGKANDANAKAVARTAQTAEETYFTDNQTYATTSSALGVIETTLSRRHSGDAHQRPAQPDGELGVGYRLQPVGHLRRQHPGHLHDRQRRRRGDPHVHAGQHGRLQRQRRLVGPLRSG